MINKRLLEYKSMESIDSDPQVLRNDYRKLNQMIDYCETQQCLRQFILSYFGDNSPCTCDKCSNCVVVEECILIARKAKDLAGRLICCGMAALIGFQSIFNIFVATGLMPNTGIPLPFVSYGLTSFFSVFSLVDLSYPLFFATKISI